MKNYANDFFQSLVGILDNLAATYAASGTGMQPTGIAQASPLFKIKIRQHKIGGEIPSLATFSCIVTKQ